MKLKTTGEGILLPIVVYPMLISILTDEKIESLFLGKKKELLCGFLGNVGYEMYIWHSTVLVMMLVISYVTNMDYTTYGFFKMLGCYIVCFVVGAIAFLRIEKPLNNSINNIFMSD